MGYRTTVILYNDCASTWEKDPLLGKKIASAMNFAMYADADSRSKADLGYGKVVECTHADTQTLAVLDSYSMTPICHSHWRPEETNEERNLKLVKEAAEKLGYRLVKKSTKEAQ